MTTLAEAKDRVIKLFTELMAEGIKIQLEDNYGRGMSLDLWLRGEFLELRNGDWHPEWSK